VYLKSYETVQDARESLGKYIAWYNNDRRHSGLRYNRPYEVLMGIKQADQWPFQGQYVEGDSSRKLMPATTKLGRLTLLEIKQPKTKITQKLSSQMAG
jgi:hypothetical protein